MLLVLAYLGVIFLKTRTKIQQSLKGALTCCKLEFAFQFFPISGPYTQRFYISVVVCKFQCDLCNDSYYGESIKHIDIRGKKVKRIESKTILLVFFPSCNHTAQKMKFSIEDFFNKCDQASSFLRITSHLLKKF